MSRLLVLLLLTGIIVPSGIRAQSVNDDEHAAMIENQHRIVALDGDGCAKYPEQDVIVVCGTPQEERDRKLFQNGKAADRIRRGEAISTMRAAEKNWKYCENIGSGLGCIQLHGKGTPFGSVPEPAIPLSEVMKGLAPQDLVNSAKEDGSE
jgi:hypothetical protein